MKEKKVRYSLLSLLLFLNIGNAVATDLTVSEIIPPYRLDLVAEDHVPGQPYDGIYQPFCAVIENINVLTAKKITGFSDFAFARFAPEEPIGIAEQEALENSLRLWPVPARGRLNMEFYSESGGTVNLVIRDIRGNELSHLTANAKGDWNKVKLEKEIQALIPGIYILELSSNNTYRVQKFLID